MASTLFWLRAQLWRNGYSPLPNRDKRCLIKGWNRNFLAREIERYGSLDRAISSWDRRFSEFQATGVTILSPLLVLDSDVDDPTLDGQLLRIIHDVAPDVFGRAPLRYGSGTHKAAWFCRLDGAPFNRRGTRKFSMSADLADYRARLAAIVAAEPGKKRPRVDPPVYHHIEFFGGAVSDSGAVSRQFGCYGPHTIGEDGAVLVAYTWAGPGLHEVPLADLPTLTPEQIDTIREEFEKAATAAGWEAHEALGGEDGGEGFAYDIDRARAVFELEGREDTVGYDDLASLYDPRHRTDCTPSFIGDVSTTFRCTLGWSHTHDCVVVMDWKTGVSHLPKDKEPAAAAETLAAALLDCAALHGVPPSADYSTPGRFTLDDFAFFTPEGRILFKTTGALWVRKSVNALLSPIVDGDGDEIPADIWLEYHAAVTCMVWAPGSPQLIPDKVPAEDGWLDKPGAVTFNTYHGPVRRKGNAANVQPWLDLVKRLYPEDWKHIVAYFAHRVQRPAEKINHALVLIGDQGIGKDTLLEPLKYAVGPWNFKEISPHDLVGKFNGYMKSVVLRISEARDLGEINRYKFYEASKTAIAAPPDSTRINEKFVPEYYAFNVTSVIFTSNYPDDALYLTPGDRRHYVAASEAKSEDFNPSIWNWYDNGGLDNVVAFLAAYPLEGFNAKATPVKTPAFWRLVDAGHPIETGEIHDVLEAAGKPDAFTVATLKSTIDNKQSKPPVETEEGIEKAPHIVSEVWEKIQGSANAKIVSRRFGDCGYEPYRNPKAKIGGKWLIDGKRCVVYVKKQLGLREKENAVQELKKEKEAELRKAFEKLKEAEEARKNNVLSPNFPKR